MMSEMVEQINQGERLKLGGYIIWRREFKFKEWEWPSSHGGVSWGSEEHKPRI
jgi:hypothetical protein